MDNTARDAAHYGMGTRITHRVSGRRALNALMEVREEAVRLERLLSRFVPESEIGRLNRSAGTRREKISAETYAVLDQAVRISAVSGGLFDVCVGPLVDLWDYKHASEPPADEMIKQVISLVNYMDLQLNAAERTAVLKKCGQSLDLGGIGKGYAGDRFMEIFRSRGITSAFSNIGGNVSTLGSRPDGSPWRVGIRHPRGEKLIGAVEVSGEAVVTSGDYERFFFGSNGRRYHHILNPFTGYPAEAGLISVTVVSGSALLADALSTAVFVAGLEKGLALINRFPSAQAVLIDKDLRMYFTAGLTGCLQTITGISKSNI